MLEAQRAAFYGDLPVSAASRRDRLRRAMLMIEANADALCAAVAADQPNQDAASTRAGELRPALAALQASIDGVERWMRPEKRRGFPASSARGADYVEYLPAGVIGIAAPAALPLLRTANLLAGAFAAGNRVVLKFDAASLRLGELVEAVAPGFFDPLELSVASGRAFAAGAFDLLVASEPPEDDASIKLRSGKSAVIVGRSADFASAAKEVIARKRAGGGRSPLAPDYLLAPDDQEEAIAGWLWRAAMQSASDDVPLTAAEQARVVRLLDDARARGGEVLTAEPRAGGLALHIVRHATGDMLAMQEDIRVPVLPLRNYARIEDAIAEIHRRPPPLAIHYFGRNAAERRRVLDHTLSSTIAINKAAPSLAGTGTGPDAGADEAGFRRFSRVRRVCRQPLLGFLGGTPRRGSDDLGEAAPALR